MDGNRRPRRILVVKLAGLGDLLTATPALRALRASFPRAHVAVLATPASAPALRGLDSVDELIPFDKFAFDRPLAAARGLPAAVALGRRLRRGRWDVLVLLHHLTTPFGIAKYAALVESVGAELSVGLDNGRGRWFLDRGAVDHGFGWQHEADYWLDVVGQIGARHPGRPRLELAIAPEDERWAEARWAELGEPAGAVMLVPGSGAFSLARRWPPERFVAVGRALRRRHRLVPLVLGGLAEDEQALARRVADGLGPPTAVVPPAPGPQALGALLRRCRAVVANDSGPVHVATAVDTPVVVSIFGPINHRAWGPYPPQAPGHVVVREPLACSPCIYRGHSFGTPAGCPARTCLAILEPPTVVAATERALARAAA
jgi:ADP-heptose:LPS heptosyltransferase